jgi:sortase (surface protein transpeptidase)
VSLRRSRSLLGHGHRRSLWLAVSIAVGGLGIGLLVLGLTAGPSSGPPPAPKADGKRLAPRMVSGEDFAPRRRKPQIDARAPSPRWIRIPAIGVSAPVVALGLNPDRTLEVPRRWGDAGWYAGGPEPGERGPAVMAGHVDSTSGPAVFYRLGQLRRGAFVHIRRADHSVVGFRVEGVERWPKDRFPTRRVYRPTTRSTLRLITCGGSFSSATGHYLDNVIVYATRIRRGDRRAHSRERRQVLHRSVRAPG